jgi:nucleoid DNA-binding protein
MPPAKKTAATSKKTLPKTRQTPMTRSEMLSHLADSTDVTKKQVQAVLDELANLMELHLKKRSVGQFTLSGLLKISVVKKPAKKARKGINPFTGEETTFKAKPAHNVVKVRPLKKLKDFAS